MMQTEQPHPPRLTSRDFNDPLRLYVGDVVHKRLRPREHALHYRVFSILADLDRAAEAASRLRLFSWNSGNVVSLHERDHGPGGKGLDLAAHARQVLAGAGRPLPAGGRIYLLCYPRMWGYAFNPLSVYFAYDDAGRLVSLIYEVNNTFKERTSYVVPAGPANGETHAQSCPKTMFVSPFAAGTGQYGFRVGLSADRVLVGVSFRDANGPLIKTHYGATGQPLTDRALSARLLRSPAMSFKVIGAIHYEALKLWLKGVPLVRGHTSPRYSIEYPRTQDIEYAE